MTEIERLRINGFKSLENLELKDLKRFNYFVGPSGAGKSSIWEWVVTIVRGSYTNGLDRFGDLARVVSLQSKVQLVLNDGINVTSKTYTIEPKSEHVLDVTEVKEGAPINDPYFIYLTSEQKQDVEQYDKISIRERYNPTEYSGPIKEALFMLADEFPDASTYDVAHITPGDNDKTLLLRGSGRDQYMSTKNLAGGHSATSALIAAIKNNNGSVIIIEEPENGMHVSLQKELHRLLKEVSGPMLTQLMIITHSPFLLSGINPNDTETNTYLIRDGKALKPEGYGAQGARYLAAKLTGISFEDIAPSKIVICEGSLRALLIGVNDRFYSSPVMITTAKSHMGGEASGDDNLLELADVETVYRQRFNFFDKADLIFIIDKPNEVQQSLRAKIDKLMAEKDTTLIELNETKLENYYEKIQGLPPEDKKYLQDISNNTKTERAARLGDVISQDEFERHFPDLAAVLNKV